MKTWQGLDAEEIASIPRDEYCFQKIERILRERNEVKQIKQEPVAWTDGKFCLSFAESDVCPIPLYTAPRELSDEEIVFTENEVNVLKNSIENYVCTIKSELTEEQNTFKGYERCSNIKAILSELEDAERALEILKKASEK